jgi:hypothetical protein
MPGTERPSTAERSSTIVVTDDASGTKGCLNFVARAGTRRTTDIRADTYAVDGQTRQKAQWSGERSRFRQVDRSTREFSEVAVAIQGACMGLVDAGGRV